jgi:hypothetical protein
MASACLCSCFENYSSISTARSARAARAHPSAHASTPGTWRSRRLATVARESRPQPLRRAQFAAATAAAAQLHPDPSPRNQPARPPARLPVPFAKLLFQSSWSARDARPSVVQLQLRQHLEAARPFGFSAQMAIHPIIGLSRADALAPLPGCGSSCSWAVSALSGPPPKVAHPQLAAAASSAARPEPSRLLSIPIRPIRICRPAAAPPRRSHPLYKRKWPRQPSFNVLLLHPSARASTRQPAGSASSRTSGGHPSSRRSVAHGVRLSSPQALPISLSRPQSSRHLRSRLPPSRLASRILLKASFRVEQHTLTLCQPRSTEPIPMRATSVHA